MTYEVWLTLRGPLVGAWLEDHFPLLRDVEADWHVSQITEASASWRIRVQADGTRRAIDRAWIAFSARVPGGADLILDHQGEVLADAYPA